MKTIFIILGITIAYLFAFNSSAQQIFKDSGQRLGNSCSWDVKLGDLNEDGFLDAVVCNTNNENSEFKNEIWLNNGNAIYSKSAQELGTGGNITLFDINIDGHLDIIEVIGSNIGTWINDGSANFSISDNYPFQGNNIIFDKNIFNDNNDVAVTSDIIENDTRLRIYSIYKDSIKITDSVTITNFRSLGIVSGELNNDGYSDLVLSQENGPTFILFNDHDGSFTISNQKPGNGYYPNIYLGDLNGDGFLDMLRCNYHNPGTSIIYPAQLYLNDGTGNYTPATLSYNSTYITPNASLLDLDNDGDLDIFLNHGHRASSDSHKSEILFNDGQGNFTSSTVNLDLVPSTGMAFGDFDNDGDLDAFLACVRYSSGAIGEPNRIWLNTTNGNTSIKTNKNGEYKIFPNPTSGQLTVSFGATAVRDEYIEIFNLQGIRVFSKIFYNTTQETIDLTCLQKGMYLIKIVANGVSYEEKTVKE